MVTMGEIHKFAKDCVATGKAFDYGFGWQCVAFIQGISESLGLGLDCYCKITQGAKDLIENAVPAGWISKRCNPASDDEGRALWNSCPNGTVLIFWNTGYGHVAIKNNVWGASDDSIQQNVGDGGLYYNPQAKPSYYSMGQMCERGGIGLIGVWYKNDGTGGQSSNDPHTQNKPNNPIQQSNSKPKNSPSTVVPNYYGDVKKALDNFVKNLIDNLNNQVYQNTQGTLYTNQFLVCRKNLNNLIVNVNEGAINDLQKEILKLLEKATNAQSKPINSTSPQNKPAPNSPSTQPADESTEEKRAELIVKICMEKNPTSNVYGLCGLLGNFAAEAGIKAEKFEADNYCTLKPKQITQNPTVEFAFDTWAIFESLYGISLNEGAYLVNGKHWLGLGLGQWTGSRNIALWEYAGKTDSMWTVKTQMEFAFSPAEGANADILRACLNNSESIEEGVFNVYHYWERAGVGDSVPYRNQKAWEYKPKVEEWIKKYKK